jgi:hypothetical protein
VFAPGGIAFGPENGREVVLFADTFNRAMNAKISTPRCACSSKAAIAFICPAQSMADAIVLRPHLPVCRTGRQCQG